MSEQIVSLRQITERASIEHLGGDEIARFRRANSIVSDPERHRPRYFDGRFLAAQDLTREQSYFLQRQADLARASTPGVIHGLKTSRINDTTLHIDAGNGVTSAGQLVVLTEALDVDLADNAGMQTLDAAFGLETIPNEPTRRRTGLFIVALRPVEYTGNPVATYPTSVTERRSVDDGEIIEAVAVTLIPYAYQLAGLSSQQQRAQAARRIFVERRSEGVSAEALPIAMVALERGFLLWVDPYMVRREVGAEHGGVAGFGTVSRAVREAQFHQYSEQLSDVTEELGRRFAAADVFRALPPAGQFPIEAIERTGDGPSGGGRYAQLYFPPQMHVLMSLIPADEIVTHVERSMLLPPLDLTVTPEQFAFTWVQVLLPVQRPLLSVRGLIRAVELAPATNERPNRATPLHAFGRLLTNQRRPNSPHALIHKRDNEKLLRETFKKASEAQALLWFVRRHVLRCKPETRLEVGSIDVGYLKGKPI